MWSTGTFIKLLKANGISLRASQRHGPRGLLYSSDIEALLPKTWKKIVTAALKIVKKKGAVKPAVTANKASHCCQIIDADESE